MAAVEFRNIDIVFGADQKGALAMIDKGGTREEIAAAILPRLRFSGEEAETILALIRLHMLFMNVREMRPNRLKRFLRTPDFSLHLELHHREREYVVFGLFHIPLAHC